MGDINTTDKKSKKGLPVFNFNRDGRGFKRGGEVVLLSKKTLFL